MRNVAVLALIAAATPAFADDAPPRAVRGETIIIRDHAPGWKQAEPKTDPRIAPKYSDAAIEQDAWTRAWLFLDIDDRGVVKRVKWLNRPGYDLEQIALDKVFKTKFEPARDGLGRAEASTLVFPIEWPSYWWIVKHEGLVTRIPQTGGMLPCKGSGNPLNLERAHPVYRDCSLPNLSALPREPWINRPR
jgi:hypothetical protein